MKLEEALAKIEALEKEKSELQSKLDESNATVKDLTKEVKGTYKAKDKSIVKFKKGCLTFIHRGQRHQSEEVLKNAELMEELIEMGSGLIEFVKSEK